MSTEERPYHHGDVPNVVLAAALAAVTEHGPAGVGLREVARRAGVSHATVTHHFGDKAGIFTAIAAEGYRRLGDELAATVESGAGFLELGVAYVRFSVSHRAHFEVMFRPELFHEHDASVAEARARTAAMLYGSAEEIAAPGEQAAFLAGIAGWALVHGIASLWLTGGLPATLGDDPEQITRRVARLLGPPVPG